MNQMTVVRAAHTPILLAAANQPAGAKADIRYIHLRRHIFPDPLHYDGSVDQPVLDSKGGATIAYIREGTKLLFCIALCNESDVFNRKIGRAVAAGRLLGGYGTEVEMSETAPRGEVTNFLIGKYYEREEQFNQDVRLFVY